MYKLGHLGLTTGLASTGAAYWLHQEFDARPSLDEDTFEHRVQERGPAIVKGLSAVAVADLMSLVVDRDLALGLGHRTVTHSWLTAGAIRPAVTTVGEQVAEAVERVADRLDSDWLRTAVAQPIRQNAGLYGTTLAAGIGLHTLGDVPTGGVGGSGLELLWPISNHAFNLGVVFAADPTLNKLLFGGGLAIAAVAWGTVLARIVLPEAQWQRVRETLASVKARVGRVKDAIVDGARSFIAKAKSVLRRVLGASSGTAHSRAACSDGGPSTAVKQIRPQEYARRSPSGAPSCTTRTGGSFVEQDPQTKELQRKTPPGW